MDHALALQRGGLGEDRRRIDRIDEVDRAVEAALRAFQADDLRHQLHQSAVAPVGIALEPVVAAQHAGGGDRIVRAADRMQCQPQVADAGFAGAQPAEQRRVFGVVVQAVGGQTQAHDR